MRLWFSESNYVSDLSADTVHIVLHERERSVFACNLMAAFIAVLYFRDLCRPARTKKYPSTFLETPHYTRFRALRCAGVECVVYFGCLVRLV